MWLLLIHQIPPKPDYLRVKIGRRLQRVGAVAIKNSVYALPATADAREDFQWIVREIEEGGGEAFVSEASLIGDGLTDDDVRARFDAARNEEYRAILADVRVLARSLGTTGQRSKKARDPRSGIDGVGMERELARLQRRYEAVNALDYFAASDGAAVTAALGDLRKSLQRLRAGDRAKSSPRHVDGATWVTRRDVHVDRIASAWLVRRFIDASPTFRVVDAKRYTHTPGELRFDMFEAEYTHVGDACTFETLMRSFALDDPALREIGEIVHDVDCKDAKFGRAEASGVARMIGGIVARQSSDDERLTRGAALFDDLYAAFGGTIEQ